MKTFNIFLVLPISLLFLVSEAQNSSPQIPNIIDQFLQADGEITEIANASDQLSKPIDLDFHPSWSQDNNQLWVLNKRTENFGSSTVIINNAGMTNQTDLFRVDANAWHFMSLATGIAFSDNTNFATSQGVYDANHDAGNPFTGPTLWSSDLNVYAQPSGGNGSHLDMLHTSPQAQGIASESDNVFWVFDGYNNDIVRYDFAEDHGPGNTYHGDAIIHRYNDVTVAKDPNEIVPSHLVVSNGWVYVVDHGNDRVFRIELNTGSIGSNPSFGPYEPLAEYKNINGYNWEEVVTTGLDKAAGIDVIEDRMIVSDYATGEIIVYDINNIPATELGRINTDAQGIMGIKIGPNGNIWYVDNPANRVYVIKSTISSINEAVALNPLHVYPNPATNVIRVNSSKEIEIYNALGQLAIQTDESNIDVSSLQKGIYIVKSEERISRFVKN
jgi:hypothetical protein